MATLGHKQKAIKCYNEAVSINPSLVKSIIEQKSQSFFNSNQPATLLIDGTVDDSSIIGDRNDTDDQ